MMDPPTLEELPPEILSMIFNFYRESEGSRELLRNVGSVSKRFRELVNSLRLNLWSDVSTYTIPFKALVDLAERGVLCHTQRLHVDFLFTAHRNLSNFDWNGFLSNFGGLRNLKIAWLDEANHRFFDAIATADLLSLELMYVSMRRAVFPCGVMDNLLETRGRNLRFLSLNEVTIDDSNLVQKIANNCPSIEELDLRFVGTTRFPIQAMQASCPKLKRLVLHGVELVSDACEETGFPLLEELDLRHHFGDSTLRPLLRGSDKLRRVSLEIAKEGEFLPVISSTDIPATELTSLKVCDDFFEPSRFDPSDLVYSFRLALRVLKLKDIEPDTALRTMLSVLRNNPEPKLQIFSSDYMASCTLSLAEFVSGCRELRTLKIPVTCLPESWSRFYHPERIVTMMRSARGDDGE